MILHWHSLLVFSWHRSDDLMLALTDTFGLAQVEIDDLTLAEPGTAWVPSLTPVFTFQVTRDMLLVLAVREG